MYDETMQATWLPVLFLSLICVGASCGSTTSASKTTRISASPAAVKARIDARGECRDVYVQGDRGRYRVTGCGTAETYICNADTSSAEEPIECALEFTSRAMTLRHKWRRARQNEAHFWPKVSGTLSGQGQLTGAGLSYGSVETVGARQPGAPAVTLPSPQ